MKKLLFAFLIFPVLVFGQFSDDFSDGDFTTNPSWQGNTEKFMVNENHELQLADNQEGTAFLSVNQQRIDSTEWLFDAALQFSPSGNNNARIYLAANSANPDLITESVFLQLGESGSEDALTLYHQNGDEETMICRGSNGLISAAFRLPVKITYREPGIWRIFIDPLNNGSYVPEAEGNYPVSFSSSSFIVFCKYTVSNSDDFVFDNFLVRPFQVDVTAPEVVSFEVISPNTLEIGFSEPVAESGAINPLNYLLNGSVHPVEVIFDEVLKDNVKLIFADPFSNNTEYQLLVSGVEDSQGNLMDPHEETFTYLQPYEPQSHEIVINELMVDVNPEPNGLPAYDYLELFNTTQRLMDLSGCIVQWSSHQREMPDGTTLKPGHFLVLTDDDADFDEGIPVVNFSSLPLNTEAGIILRNADLQIIHALDYKKEWYHDGEKEEGGWSLEMIDPENPCGGITNFSASVDQDGGTPGMINSVFDENPDVENPEMSHVMFVSDSILLLRFSETMDSTALKNPQNYLLSPPGISPDMVRVSAPGYKEIRLVFSQGVYVEDTRYHLQIDSLTDCVGNGLENRDINFSTYAPRFSDVLITEVMADVNPAPLGLPPVEYVEIYNKTSYSIDLSGWALFSNDSEKEIPGGTMIEPQEYLVFTEDEASFANEIVIPGLSVSNDGSALYLADNEGDVIHYIDYKRDWFTDPLKAEGGWSVEIIDISNYCGAYSNWDATNHPDGGTPGKQNSIAGENPDQRPPDVLRIAALTDSSIRIYFDELMNRAGLENIDSYTVEPSLSLSEVHRVSPSSGAVDLVFSNPMDPGLAYRLLINSGISDCVGNPILVSGEVLFTYPLQADTGDIVINEVLFNSGENNEDFLEIYNLSENAIDLSSIFLSLLDPVTNELEKKIAISGEKFILLKNSFIALSRNERNLLGFYPDAPPRNLFTVGQFPALPSREGKVMVQSLGNKALDSLSYDEDMHFGLLNEYKDVSLERIDPYAKSNDNENWHSASEASGFATPGEKNSQHLSGKISDMQVQVSPKVVTPNNDGQNDVAVVHINPGEAGYSANITVYDARGREVVLLKKNHLLGMNNKVFWDGTDEKRRVVRSGYYIIYLELFDLKGNIQHFKKTVVVSSN